MLLENKKVLAAGMGKSGAAVIEILLSARAEVYVYDAKTKEKIDTDIIKKVEKHGLKSYFGILPESIGSYDLLVMSPGIPLSIPLVTMAKKAGVEIIGELELAYRLCKGKFIAITGTNGKTTTTALTGEIFKNAGRDTFIVGNIGVAAVSKAIFASEESYMVTEVSSFQLETIKNFKPKVSAVLNITPDHLNRHKTMENYAKAKARIYMNQDETQYFIVNYDNPEAYALKDNCKARVIPFSRTRSLDLGCYVHDQEICIKDEFMNFHKVCSIEELQIPGNHNLENALASTAIAYWSGIPTDIIGKTLKGFEGVEHRMEYVDNINGIRFINDSKGTNPDASVKAIEAIQTPMVLIAGGMNKGSEFRTFIKAFNGKVKYLVLLGETAHKIKETANEMGFNNVVIQNNMERCVQKAFKMAEAGEAVLLSPACASWDMYPNFEARGQHFKDCVEGLRRTLDV